MSNKGTLGLFCWLKQVKTVGSSSKSSNLTQFLLQQFPLLQQLSSLAPTFLESLAVHWPRECLSDASDTARSSRRNCRRSSMARNSLEVSAFLGLVVYSLVVCRTNLSRCSSYQLCSNAHLVWTRNLNVPSRNAERDFQVVEFCQCRLHTSTSLWLVCKQKSDYFQTFNVKTFLTHSCLYLW